MHGDDGSWLHEIAAISEMGRAVEQFDWAATALGPPSTWPEGLRSAVSICLSTHFPALVLWGPDLVQLYNDGYRPMLGSEKHPHALGAAAKEVWPEIWDSIGPLFHSVMTSGRPTWAKDQELILERSGFAEECFFTFSYSPLFDADRVAGVLDLVFETTEQVVAQRRLTCLTALNAALAGAEQVTDVCVAATAALAEQADDVCFIDVFLRVGSEIALVASNRRDDRTPADRIDIDAAVRGETLVAGCAGEGFPAELVALPLGGPFADVRGALVTSLNPRRPFDEEFRRFLQAIAETISSALYGAYRRSVEIGEYRRISDTLQAAMLPPSSDRPTIAARYLPAVGNLAVGGDWYDVIDLDERRRCLVVGDCVGHGLDAATVMAQLRSAARAMLLEGRRPAEVLEGLDAFAAHLDGAECATVVCVIYDRDEQTITFARAGHPPPLIVGPHGPRWLEGSNGPPLAVAPDRPRTDATIDIADGEIIVLYSDGLVERRDEGLDAGLERLAEAAARLYQSSVQAIADALLRELLPENARDDVVLVVKRFHPDLAADLPAD